MANINRTEILHAQFALAIAILLQVFVLVVNPALSKGPQYVIIATELGLALLLGLTINMHTRKERELRNHSAGTLLGFISVANIGALLAVLYSLIVGHASLTGFQLLSSAIAIFLTNILVYALWYWEIDSPGFTSNRWSKHDRDFQFTQQNMPKEFPVWEPTFIDYLHVSLTNAINFAPADAKPLTHVAKVLMSSQALISLFTLALLVARSVSLLG
jgi:hypothetical protein